MLFNSLPFVLGFLPVVLVGFHLSCKAGQKSFALLWLIGASFFFYGWWNPVYLWLISASLVFNYSLGRELHRRNTVTTEHQLLVKKVLLVLGVSVNLVTLGYYKYAGFFLDNINTLLQSQYSIETIILPLAISFFTFEQIAFLVDAYKGKTELYKFSSYAVFVTFFPQFIAGPIVHHSEIIP